MEIKDMYVVNENGQLEINFYSLELITSADFIENLKGYIDDLYASIIIEKIFVEKLTLNDVINICILTPFDVIHVYYFPSDDWEFNRINRFNLELVGLVKK